MNDKLKNENEIFCTLFLKPLKIFSSLEKLIDGIFFSSEKFWAKW